MHAGPCGGRDQDRHIARGGRRAALYRARAGLFRQAKSLGRAGAAYRAGAKDYHDAFTGPDERPNAGPAAVETLRILANYTGQPIELLKLGVPHIDGDARVDVKNIADQIAWYKSHGMVKPEVDAAKIIDTRYVIALGQ